MAFPCYKQKTECFYLIYKTGKKISSDPTSICTVLVSAPPSGKNINQNKNYLQTCDIIVVEWLEEYEKPKSRAISRLITKLWQIYGFTVPGSSGTIGTAIQKKCFF
jgi:hypothetical protein